MTRHLKLALGLLLATALQASQQLSIANSEQQRHKQAQLARFDVAANQQQASGQNDLFNSPLDSHHHDHHHHDHHHHQAQPSTLNYNKHALHSASESGLAVINGNSATYVAPPADFKPIIYEPQAAAAAAVLADTFESPNQLGKPSAAAAVPPARFSGVASSSQMSSSNNINQIAANSKPNRRGVQAAGQEDELELAAAIEEQALDGGDNALPLKPSIGRWSDWHDMSIEPDLAASDSQPMASKLAAPQPQQTQTAAAAYKTRYRSPQSAGSTLSADGKPIKWSFASANANGQQVAPQLAHSDKLARKLDSQQMSASGGELHVGRGAPVRLLPLKVDVAQQEQRGNLIRMQQSPGVEYASPFWLAADGGEPRAANQFEYHSDVQPPQAPPRHHLYLVSPALAHPPPSPMHFLMAHHHLHQPAAMGHLQAVAPLERAPPVAFHERGSGGGGEIGARPPSRNLFVRRLLVAQAPLPPPPSAAKLHQRKNAEVRLISAPSGSSSQGKPAGGGQKSASGNNSTSAPLAQPQGRPRLLKRRRIVSTRPVGLSSWFLGGMRDLDARFWKLPAELLSKLAVNDVDLVHEDGQASAFGQPQAPPSGETEPAAIKPARQPAISELEQAGPPLPTIATNQRAANSQRPIKRR